MAKSLADKIKPVEVEVTSTGSLADAIKPVSEAEDLTSLFGATETGQGIFPAPEQTLSDMGKAPDEFVNRLELDEFERPLFNQLSQNRATRDLLTNSQSINLANPAKLQGSVAHTRLQEMNQGKDVESHARILATQGWSDDDIRAGRIVVSINEDPQVLLGQSKQELINKVLTTAPVPLKDGASEATNRFIQAFNLRQAMDQGIYSEEEVTNATKNPKSRFGLDLPDSDQFSLFEKQPAESSQFDPVFDMLKGASLPAGPLPFVPSADRRSARDESIISRRRQQAETAGGAAAEKTFGFLGRPISLGLLALDPTLDDAEEQGLRHIIDHKLSVASVIKNNPDAENFQEALADAELAGTITGESIKFIGLGKATGIFTSVAEATAFRSGILYAGSNRALFIDIRPDETVPLGIAREAFGVATAALVGGFVDLGIVKAGAKASGFFEAKAAAKKLASMEKGQKRAFYEGVLNTLDDNTLLKQLADKDLEAAFTKIDEAEVLLTRQVGQSDVETPLTASLLKEAINNTTDIQGLDALAKMDIPGVLGQNLGSQIRSNKKLIKYRTDKVVDQAQRSLTDLKNIERNIGQLEARLKVATGADAADLSAHLEVAKEFRQTTLARTSQLGKKIAKMPVQEDDGIWKLATLLRKTKQTTKNADSVDEIDELLEAAANADNEVGLTGRSLLKAFGQTTKFLKGNTKDLAVAAYRSAVHGHLADLAGPQATAIMKNTEAGRIMLNHHELGVRWGNLQRSNQGAAITESLSKLSGRESKMFKDVIEASDNPEALAKLVGSKMSPELEAAVKVWQEKFAIVEDWVQQLGAPKNWQSLGKTYFPHVIRDEYRRALQKGHGKLFNKILASEPRAKSSAFRTKLVKSLNDPDLFEVKNLTSRRGFNWPDEAYIKDPDVVFKYYSTYAFNRIGMLHPEGANWAAQMKPHKIWSTDLNDTPLKTLMLSAKAENRILGNMTESAWKHVLGSPQKGILAEFEKTYGGGFRAFNAATLLTLTPAANMLQFLIKGADTFGFKNMARGFSALATKKGRAFGIEQGALTKGSMLSVLDIHEADLISRSLANTALAPFKVTEWLQQAGTVNAAGLYMRQSTKALHDRFKRLKLDPKNEATNFDALFRAKSWPGAVLKASAETVRPLLPGVGKYVLGDIKEINAIRKVMQDLKFTDAEILRIAQTGTLTNLDMARGVQNANVIVNFVNGSPADLSAPVRDARTALQFFRFLQGSVKNMQDKLTGMIVPIPIRGNSGKIDWRSWKAPNLRSWITLYAGAVGGDEIRKRTQALKGKDVRDEGPGPLDITPKDFVGGAKDLVTNLWKYQTLKWPDWGPRVAKGWMAAGMLGLAESYTQMNRVDKGTNTLAQALGPTAGRAWEATRYVTGVITDVIKTDAPMTFAERTTLFLSNDNPAMSIAYALTQKTDHELLQSKAGNLTKGWLRSKGLTLERPTVTGDKPFLTLNQAMIKRNFSYNSDLTSKTLDDAMPNIFDQSFGEIRKQGEALISNQGFLSLFGLDENLKLYKSQAGSDLDRVYDLMFQNIMHRIVNDGQPFSVAVEDLSKALGTGGNAVNNKMKAEYGGQVSINLMLNDLPEEQARAVETYLEIDNLYKMALSDLVYTVHDSILRQAEQLNIPIEGEGFLWKDNLELIRPLIESGDAHTEVYKLIDDTISEKQRLNISQGKDQFEGEFDF